MKLLAGSTTPPSQSFSTSKPTSIMPGSTSSSLIRCQSPSSSHLRTTPLSAVLSISNSPMGYPTAGSWTRRPLCLRFSKTSKQSESPTTTSSLPWTVWRNKYCPSSAISKGSSGRSGNLPGHVHSTAQLTKLHGQSLSTHVSKAYGTREPTRSPHSFIERFYNDKKPPFYTLSISVCFVALIANVLFGLS